MEFEKEIQSIKAMLEDCKKRGVLKCVIATRYKEMVVQTLGFGTALQNSAVEFRLQ